MVSAMVGKASAACSSSVGVINLNQAVANLVHTTRILYPKAAGSYPVLTFLHGFALDVESYDEILCGVAEDNIVILFQMKFRAVQEGLEEDAQSIAPYLYDADKGILPRIGTKILSGYSYTHIGFAGHSRGGGVLAHAFTSNILSDGDYSAVAFIDPVVMHPDKDLPNSIKLRSTKVRALYFNDPESICVTHGWPDAIGDKVDAVDIAVSNSSECKHMDVCSSWVSAVPMCRSSNVDECREKAVALLADAGFGPASVVTV
jgi:hypothetical protein